MLTHKDCSCFDTGQEQNNDEKLAAYQGLTHWTTHKLRTLYSCFHKAGESVVKGQLFCLEARQKDVLVSPVVSGLKAVVRQRSPAEINKTVFRNIACCLLMTPLPLNVLSSLRGVEIISLDLPGL